MTDFRDTVEIGKFGFSAGFNFNYKFSDNLIVEAEILFSDKGEKTKKYTLTQTGNMSEIIDLRSVSAATFNHHYYYLDVPLKINYYLLTKNVRFYFTAGVSFNTFLYQKTTTVLEKKNGSEEKLTSFSQPKTEIVNLSLLAGVGINYNLTDRYSLKLEPVFKHSLNPIINKDAPIKSYLYSLGLNIGIAYYF
jgi:opacity protein-like surface antigen